MNLKKNKNIADYFRWIISGVLIIAGILKILNPENLVEILLFFGLFDEFYSYIFTYTASTIEIVLGVFLVFRGRYKLVQKVVFSLFVIFLGISLIGYMDNWQFACGCLGRFSFGKFDLSMVLRNSTLVAMAGWVLWEKRFTRELHTG